MRQLTVLWLVVAFLAAACLGLFLKLQSVQTHQNDALHSIICHAESFVKASKTLTPDQKRQTIRFYDGSLADANLKPCP